MNQSAKSTDLQMGEIRIQVVSGGRFVMDGGTMFGVVPKMLWSRKAVPDQNNCLRQDANCLLVETTDQLVLVDTGYGSKLTDKQRGYLESEPGNPLCENLLQLGVMPQDIDVVVFSHLHFDHAGGATVRDATGELKPTFPNAKYVVQQREWELATAEIPELEGAYPLENLSPLEATGQLQLIDGAVEIVPGVRSLPTGGHTPCHQAIQIGDGNDAAVYLGDLCPTSHHLPMRWGTSYDLDVLETRRAKIELLALLADRNWWACFDHDAEVAYARIHRGEKGFEVV